MGGGGTGSDDLTASVGDVLTGKTAITADSDDEVAVGTMPNNGAVSANLNCGGNYTIPAGYHNGSGKIVANSLASQTPANATAAQILTGHNAWSNGNNIAGSMANHGNQSRALNCGATYTIPAGYHAGGGVITANSLASQTAADASAARIYSGHTAWVNGVKVTGNMTCNSILSFSVAASGNQVTFTWRNPVAATGKPFEGVFIAYSTSSYPGANLNAARAYTGVGNNTASGGYSSATVTLEYGTTYYFSCTAYSNFYANGTHFMCLLGNTLNASCTTGSVAYMDWSDSGVDDDDSPWGHYTIGLDGDCYKLYMQTTGSKTKQWNGDDAELSLHATVGATVVYSMAFERTNGGDAICMGTDPVKGIMKNSTKGTGLSVTVGSRGYIQWTVTAIIGYKNKTRVWLKVYDIYIDGVKFI